MNRHVDVIEILRNANPVPPGAAQDEPPTLEELLGSQLERNDVMSSTITKPVASTKTRPGWPKYLGAVAALVVVIAVLVPMTLPVASDVEWGDVPADQRAAIEQVAAAINGREADAFTSAFVSGGTFATYIQYEPRSACCDSYPVDEPPFVETWMNVGDAWGLEAEIESCEAESAESVRCQVRSRWDNLQMELGEDWLFVFDGSDLRSWGMLFGAPDPADSAMPMSYEDLARWQEWVEANHPDQAERFFGGTFGDLSIDGVPYESNILRFVPGRADEIRASIEEYVTSR